MLAGALSVTATILTVARGWPQVSRIALHRNVSGVSPTTWTLMLVAHVAWTVWAGSIGVVAVVVANVLAAAGCVAVLLSISRHSRLSSWRSAWSALGSAVVSGLIYFIGGGVPLSIALTTLTGFMVLPQVMRAFRFDPSGISAVTWWLAVASSVAWSLYYLLIGQPMLIAPNCIIFPSALLILGRIYASRSAGRISPAGP
jgi:uncharacterized protein with PQ loop repeat